MLQVVAFVYLTRIIVYLLRATISCRYDWVASFTQAGLPLQHNKTRTTFAAHPPLVWYGTPTKIVDLSVNRSSPLCSFYV